MEMTVRTARTVPKAHLEMTVRTARTERKAHLEMTVWMEGRRRRWTSTGDPLGPITSALVAVWTL
jgi:hypothetical protein